LAQAKFKVQTWQTPMALKMGQLQTRLLLMLCAAVLLPLWLGQSGQESSFSIPASSGKRSRREPQKKIPYSFHIEAQVPSHLADRSFARKFIETELAATLSDFQKDIRHVEVHLQVSEHFHHHQMLAPYTIKATVRLKDHHTVALPNPEKHAQLSLEEAVFYMCDVLDRGLRDEREKAKRPRKKAAPGPSIDDDSDFGQAALEAAWADLQAMAAERDAEEAAMLEEVLNKYAEVDSTK